MLLQVLEFVRPAGRTVLAGLTAGSIVVGAALGAATGQDASEEQARPKVEILLDRLAHSPSRESASRLERQILADWTASGSDTVDLLMQWAADAMADKDNDRALDYLNRVVTLAPEFSEGWNRRATIYYLLDDYANSLSDIGHVLSLQPRHFGALNGLGLVLDDIEQQGPALDAFRKALEVHPFLDGVQKRIDRLAKELEGQPI